MSTHIHFHPGGRIMITKKTERGLLPCLVKHPECLLQILHCLLLMFSLHHETTELSEVNCSGVVFVSFFNHLINLVLSWVQT